jgi:hypothetical protein
MNDTTDSLDELIGRLEVAAEQLRSGELSTDAAATLVDECAALANRAGAELDRRARAVLDRSRETLASGERAGGVQIIGQPPGQDSLL